MSGKGISRRDFFRKLAGKTAKLPAYVIACSVAKACFDDFVYSGSNMHIDPNPVNKQESNDYEGLGRVVDIEIEGIKNKLYGVYHCRKFAKSNYKQLDNLIKNSSVVVSEASPSDMHRSEVTNDGKAYFGTLLQLCQEYNKPVVYLDSLSILAYLSQAMATLTGTVLAFDNISRISEKIQENKLTKRNLLQLGAPALLGTYFFMSGTSFPDPLKKLIYRDLTKRLNHEHSYFNHIIDQRNVEIADRLTQLPKLLHKNTLNNGGEYILSVFGLGHIPGIEYYIKNPKMRKFKSLAYSVNYDLIDSNKIELFTPSSYYKGEWLMESLN